MPDSIGPRGSSYDGAHAPALLAPWTESEARARLFDLGCSEEDAAKHAADPERAVALFAPASQEAATLRGLLRARSGS